MKHTIVLFTILLFFSISAIGCATSLTMTGKAYSPVAPIKVKVLFKDKPKCNYEELGFISTPMLWNQNHAVEAAREKAAEIGADYIVIETVYKNGYNDASVSATAYKCGVVDRNNIDLNKN